jgi:hypothetical protein
MSGAVRETFDAVKKRLRFPPAFEDVVKMGPMNPE